jgi:hypothetical protein
MWNGEMRFRDGGSGFLRFFVSVHLQSQTEKRKDLTQRTQRSKEFTEKTKIGRREA